MSACLQAGHSPFNTHASATVASIAPALQPSCPPAAQPAKPGSNTFDRTAGSGAGSTVLSSPQQTSKKPCSVYAAQPATYSWQDAAPWHASPQVYSPIASEHAGPAASQSRHSQSSQQTPCKHVSQAARQSWQFQSSQQTPSQHASHMQDRGQHCEGRQCVIGVQTDSLAALERAAKTQPSWANTTLHGEPGLQLHHGFLTSAVMMETLNRQKQAELLQPCVGERSDEDTPSGLQSFMQQKGVVSPQKGSAGSPGPPDSPSSNNRYAMFNLLIVFSVCVFPKSQTHTVLKLPVQRIVLA